MRKLERVIEDGFVNWIVNNHCAYKAVKMNLDGRNGWPDRMITGPNRFLLFIEFKRSGESPTPLQQFYHDYLTECGYEVEVCDNLEKAKRVFLNLSAA